jgi:serine/threonine protein kinase
VIRWSHGITKDGSKEEENGEESKFKPTVDVDMWCLGCCLLEVHTGRDLVDHLGYGKEEEKDEESPVLEIFSNSDADIMEEINLILDNEFKGEEESEEQPRSINKSNKRHVRSLLKKLLTLNVLSTNSLDAFVDQMIDELVPDAELSEELKDILVSVLEADLSNDDELVDSIYSAFEGLLVNRGEALKCKLKLFLMKIVDLKKSRRISMAQLKSHAYMTGRAGTTTMRGKKMKRNVDSNLEKLEATMSRIEAQLGSGYQEDVEEVMQEFELRMVARLGGIEEQLQDVYDRLNQA